MQNARIPEGDRAVFEDKVLSKVLDAAVKIDGLNFCNSLAFEMIVRRKQLLCEAHVGNPGQPSFEGSNYFMGVRYRPGGEIVIPSLTEHGGGAPTSLQEGASRGVHYPAEELF